MNYTVQHQQNEQKDRRKSILITFLLSFLVFLGIFFYKFTKITEKPEEVTTMLLNFGDNRDGTLVEEPANQDGSLASNAESQETPAVVETPEPVVKERIISGNNPATSTPKAEKTTKKTSVNPAPAKATLPKSAATKATIPKTGTADGKGNAAIGNLIKGRGTKNGSQGTASDTGNSGDPLGGEGNGDSKIGVDRKLIGFIPGTMGRGGAQPAHNCSASGSITIAYTVDKAGNVVSARRSGGVSDPCVVASSVSWVKTYVKAEPSTTSSSGSYSIIF